MAEHNEDFDDELLDEFAVQELEDRFEFTATCAVNENCDCPQSPEEELS